jgi:ferric-dicitrate binding protein FerR (iron transport regulator)
MRPHSPKTAALAAYQAGALSPPRAAQVQAHLEDCDVCRKELASIRLWSRESARMRAVKDVPVDFSKMELALAREARSEAAKVNSSRGSRRLLPMLVPLALAAAVLLTLGFDRLVGGPPAPPLAARRAAGAEGALLAHARTRVARTEVVLVAGETSLRGGEVPTVGMVLGDGAVLDTGAGELHFLSDADDAEDGTRAIAMRAHSSVLVSGADEVELLSGAMSVASTSRVVVLAARYRIAAEVATFDVWLSDEGVAVEVYEGSVHVTGLGEDQRLVAPARFAPPALPSSLRGAARAVGTRPEGSVLVRIERPGSVRWELDALGSLEGIGVLSFEMVPGPLHLISYDALGRAFPLDAVVGADGLLVAGEALVPVRPTLRGFLEPEIINAVVHTSLPSLQRCYEHALRLRPELGGGALRLRVSLDGEGRVVRTRIEGGDVPETLQACATAEAERWSFPSPGGPVSFDLPLRFRSH